MAERVDLDAAAGRARESYRWATAEAELVPLSTREHYGTDFPAMVAELRELRDRYGRDDEVWCGARRDQAGSAYCVEMAGHEWDGVGHMWSQPHQAALARWRNDPAAGHADPSTHDQGSGS